VVLSNLKNRSIEDEPCCVHNQRGGGGIVLGTLAGSRWGSKVYAGWKSRLVDTIAPDPLHNVSGTETAGRGDCSQGNRWGEWGGKRFLKVAKNESGPPKRRTWETNQPSLFPKGNTAKKCGGGSKRHKLFNLVASRRLRGLGENQTPTSPGYKNLKKNQKKDPGEYIQDSKQGGSMRVSLGSGALRRKAEQTCRQETDGGMVRGFQGKSTRKKKNPRGRGTSKFDQPQTHSIMRSRHPTITGWL